MNILIVPVILFFVGLGYSCLLVKRLPGSGPGLIFSMAPLLGAAILILEGALLSVDLVTLHQLRWIFVCTLAISITLVSVCPASVRAFVPNLKEVTFRQWGAVAAFFLFVVVVAFVLNPFHGGFLSYRLGVDLAAYASASSEILNLAPANNLSVEILRNAHRWGLPGLTATIYGLIPWQINIYEILFAIILTMFAAGALSAGLIYARVFFEEDRAPDINIALFIAFALVANSAQLNYLNEGFYPQIIGTSLLGTALGLFLQLRKSNWSAALPAEPRRLFYDGVIVAVMSIFFGAIAVTYSEALVLGIVFVVGCFILDLLVFDRAKMRACGLAAVSVLFGLALALPVSKDLARFTFDNTGNVRNIGYPQPNWMLPSELVGVGTIYANATGYLDNAVSVRRVPRSKIGIFIGVLSSLLVILLIVQAAGLLRDRSYVLTAILGVIGFFVVNVWLWYKGGMPPNYAYNKLSSILSVSFIPLVVVGSVVVGLRKSGGGALALPKYLRKTSILLLLVICGTAVFALRDARKFSANIDLESLSQLNDQLKACGCALLPTERGRRGAAMIGKLRYVDRTGDFIMSSVLLPPVLDQWNRAAWAFNAKNDSKVFLLVRKDYLIPGAIITKHLVADSHSYAVINTGTTVGALSEKSDVELAKWMNYVVSRNTSN